MTFVSHVKSFCHEMVHNRYVQGLAALQLSVQIIDVMTTLRQSVSAASGASPEQLQQIQNLPAVHLLHSLPARIAAVVWVPAYYYTGCKLMHASHSLFSNMMNNLWDRMVGAPHRASGPIGQFLGNSTRTIVVSTAIGITVGATFGTVSIALFLSFVPNPHTPSESILASTGITGAAAIATTAFGSLGFILGILKVTARTTAAATRAVKEALLKQPHIPSTVISHDTVRVEALTNRRPTQHV